MNNKTSSGLGLASVITIVFVVLKLVGTIDWSWWWVFSPLWIDLILTVLVIVGTIAYHAYGEYKFYSSRK